ncbi:asparagine synthase B [Halobacillus amylolyticus]|uniref:asparagine synthase (glutamine-hydrolyzing) n=1 Tax=Halobacillus amylolyticus TaxID=2932259 RepID=A0ABY4HAC8_9BACI|nr:asparagine synthase B [Halobacillus amylolyticus]UOR11383.1 asparagine synthase B [Halobacillus amylolyticus]
MCGIYAMTGKTTEKTMNQILESMHHRGPDEGKAISLKNFHLGQRRLSIIGLEDGIQPIGSKDDDKWIVCNGEIYNYLSLKEELSRTTSFLTASDSEVALKMYEQKGPEGVRDLDGMFAFFIADQKNNTFMAARDTLGIKPLYYGKDEEGNLAFSSELKTLYLVTEKVHEFPPGYYYTPEDGFVCYRKIKTPHESEVFNSTNEKAIMAGIERDLKRSVDKRLLADVEVGVLLSGGLDSSLIAALAAKLEKGNAPVKSFCVGAEGSEDIVRAREVAQAIGSEHYEYIYSKAELIEVLPEVIYNLESFEPSLVRSALPNYFVSRLAAQHVKVILSGEGADELFAGYDYMKDFSDTKQLNSEIIRVINTLHNINLQRADRMSMAHSLELRVPFLDLELIDFALKIPADLKLHNKKTMEKNILRNSFNNVLPEHILWRKKEEFSAGSGALDILDAYAEETISDKAWKKLDAEAPIRMRSKQECLYFQIFKEQFPYSTAINTVGRWATS